MTEHRILLDVDTGIDDALAIIYLAASAEVEFVAAGSVHGNVDARRAALNTLRVLEVCGYDDVPVALGAAEPLAQPLRVASYVHGADGLGDVVERRPVVAMVGEEAPCLDQYGVAGGRTFDCHAWQRTGARSSSCRDTPFFDDLPLHSEGSWSKNALG